MADREKLVYRASEYIYSFKNFKQSKLLLEIFIKVNILLKKLTKTKEFIA